MVAPRSIHAIHILRRISFSPTVNVFRRPLVTIRQSRETFREPAPPHSSDIFLIIAFRSRDTAFVLGASRFPEPLNPKLFNLNFRPQPLGHQADEAKGPGLDEELRDHLKRELGRHCRLRVLGGSGAEGFEVADLGEHSAWSARSSSGRFRKHLVAPPACKMWTAGRVCWADCPWNDDVPEARSNLSFPHDRTGVIFKWSVETEEGWSLGD